MPLTYTVGEPIPLVRALNNNTLQHYLRVPITLASGMTYQVEIPADGDVVANARDAVRTKIGELEAILSLSSP